ncbi:MAG: ABC transporter substrate-binding protein [Thermomicrobiales bacterium]
MNSGQKVGTSGMDRKTAVNRRDLIKATGGAGVAVAGASIASRGASAGSGWGTPLLNSSLQASGEVIASLRNGIIRQDPTQTGSVSDIAVNYQHYETLVDKVSSSEYVGVLAESWSNPDELTWEFKLRSGVKFHNGDSLTADDVVATLERWTNPDVGAPMGPILYPDDVIAEVIAVDDLTAQIKTTRPFGGLLASLLLTYIMPAGPTRAAGTDPIPENIGTGPFRMTEWVQADHINLVAFDEYWGEPAKIESLVYRHIVEDATRLAALRAGELHILDELSQDQKNVMDGESGFYTLTQQTVESLYPVFNVTIPPFDNELVRRAFNFGIDMQSIIDALLGEGSARQIAPVSPEVFAFNDGLAPYTYDPDQAKALLEEAGYADGFECLFVVPGDRYPAGRDLAQAIAASAQQIGVTVNVEVPEMNAAFAMTAAERDRWHLFQWGISAVNGDPDFPLRWFFHSRDDDTYQGTSAVSWTSPEVDQLLDEGSATIDQEARGELYKEAQALIWDAAPCLWQHHVVDIYGVNEAVQGLTLKPDKRPRMADITISG